jgi:ABC-type multidrug transport system fused ATPase/permease subunit
MNGSVGYAAQVPWILNTSLKQNIIYGSSYDHDKYKQVIEACALQEDINKLSELDDTEIEFNGSNLSGG